jgi:light-regulated signal transduction histidine kinase (bacteriophytochrome)
MNRVVDDVTRSLHIAIDEAKAEINRGDLPTVMGDSEQIGHVMQNLISNANKYSSSAPPRIGVSAERRAGKWLLIVKDNGIGFPKQYAEEIFQAFKRLDSRRSGTGIGLSYPNGLSALLSII